MGTGGGQVADSEGAAACWGAGVLLTKEGGRPPLLDLAAKELS